MTTPERLPSDRHGLGVWNAYVIRGHDPDDRSARLAAVPAHLRSQVRAHAVCYFNLRRLARLLPPSP